MPFEPKLKADYVELINYQLDAIPVHCIEDFDLVCDALHNIIEPDDAYLIPEKYQEKISQIKDDLQSPEAYVQFVQDYAEYQQIIKDRITSKIREFKTFHEQQKQSYIQDQQSRREQAVSNQQNMQTRVPPEPGTEAHVVAEQAQSMRDLPNIFRRGSFGEENNTEIFPEPPQQINIDVLLEEAIDAGIITRDQYLQIPSFHQDSMETLFSPDGREAFAAGIINLEQYLAIPSYDRKTMETLFSPDGREAVATGIINLEQYLAIPALRREEELTRLITENSSNYGM